MRKLFAGSLVLTCLLSLPCQAFEDPAARHLEDAGGMLGVANRDILVSNPGKFRVPDEQLHFPWLFESPNGAWYLTYREGPHNEAQWKSAGNRVQCVQSFDRGKTWIPWMGMRAEPWMYQFFVTRLNNGTLVSYRCRMTGLRQEGTADRPDGTTTGTAIILTSKNDGATWQRRHVPVTNMPFSTHAHLVTLWGRAIELPDGRWLWGIISRERNPADSKIGVVESVDGGKSFRFVTSLCHDVIKQVGEPREPGIERLPSGELVALIRSSPMILVRSSDGGHTWSKPRNLNQPGVCPQLLRLPNGVLVASYGTRNHMHVIASWDGRGKQWTRPLVTYKGQTGGYSNLQITGKNRFRVCYQEGTFNKFQPGGHRIVRLELTATRK
ncbi:MAG: hypothetical protein CMJ69_12190 [Planctomycetaceae bacterium]|nr:hypothetical protein [Planctomycetaceae bacterium]